MDELLRYMKAMVLLQLDMAQRQAADSKGPLFRPELLLAQAGFAARDIATMVDKSPAAVAKAISRARAARRGTDGSDGLPSSDTGVLHD
jgi:DNA-directed RNA polymerase specialized sigma24 family protein